MNFKHRGNFKKTESFLKSMSKNDPVSILSKYGREGVAMLASATPVDTGKTASSWGYEITKKGDQWTLAWTNSNIAGGVPVAILLQYGHATRNGGYVRGVDYINPAVRPIFQRIADEAWKEVVNA